MMEPLGTQKNQSEKGQKAFEREGTVCKKAFGLKDMGYAKAYNLFYYLSKGYL